MLHARLLASFLDPNRVTVATVTPGSKHTGTPHHTLMPEDVSEGLPVVAVVNTALFRGYPMWYRAVTWPVRALYLRPAAEAAEGVVWAVTARGIEGQSGKYYADGKVVDPSEAAQDDELAEALCMATSQLLAGGNTTRAKEDVTIGGQGKTLVAGGGLE